MYVRCTSNRALVSELATSNPNWTQGQIYDGHFMRSRDEVKYARYLDRLVIPYEYQEHRFPYLHDGRWRMYVPDFFVPEFDTFVEIKGWNDGLLPLKLQSVRDNGFSIEVLRPEEVPDESVLHLYPQSASQAERYLASRMLE